MLAELREGSSEGDGEAVPETAAKGMTADRTQGYLAGVDDYIPKPFDPDELERLLLGSPDVDIDTMRAFAEYHSSYAHSADFGESSAVCLWFFEIWRSYASDRRGTGRDRFENFSQLDISAFISTVLFSRSFSSFLFVCLGLLLAFITGTSRIPLDGFDPPFTIVDGGAIREGSREDKHGEQDVPLPRCHTCFNQIVLPRYRSYDELLSKIDYALDNNSSGFHLS